MAKKAVLGAAPERRAAAIPNTTAQTRDPATDDQQVAHLGARVPLSVLLRYQRLSVDLGPQVRVRTLLIEAIDLLEAKYGKA